MAYLWGIGQQYNLPPMTELTIFDHSGRVLISSVSPSGRSDPEIRITGSQCLFASLHMAKR